MADDERYIVNPSPDWTAFKVHLYKTESSSDGRYIGTAECGEVLQKSRSWLKSHVREIGKHYPFQSDIAPSSNARKSTRDGTIYTGAGGNAFMYWRLSRFYKLEGDKDQSFDCLMKALEAMNTALMVPNNSGVAFYCGMAGLHALSTVLYSDYEEPLKVVYHIQQLLSKLQEALHSDTPDELLYGRAGYLYCLLFVQKHIAKDICDKTDLQQAMKRVFTKLMESGKQQCLSKKSLRYVFYGTDYLGAAHGVAGILYMLLQFPDWCNEPETKSWIVSTLDHLLALQNHGNFPTTTDSVQHGHMSVHWCHGAPGFTALLYRAYEVFNDVKYLKGMEIALDCVWKYGILKKGFGVCHGIAGNAYCFLSLYKLTRQEEYYYKAVKMAECMFNDEIKDIIGNYYDPQRYRVGVPDSPYSLMEGEAGTICFFSDLLYPEHSVFPGYEI